MTDSRKIISDTHDEVLRLKHLALCYEKYGVVLFNLIFKYVKCRDDSEEILQEVFEKLCSKKVAVDPEVSSARLFLMKTAKNLALDHIRKYKWESKNIINANIDIISDNRYELKSLEDAVLEGEVLSTMHDVLNSLPEKEKQILIDKITRGRSLKSIAAERGISLYKTTRALQNALGTLNKALRDFSD
jgi:RNA polymerase sigma-70 factor (ECF subfamily)